MAELLEGGETAGAVQGEILGEEALETQLLEGVGYDDGYLSVPIHVEGGVTGGRAIPSRLP